MFRKAFFLFLLSCFFSTKIFPQAMLKGNELFNKFDYSLSIKYYKKALGGRHEQQAINRLADCYRLINNPEEAEKWYAKALEYPDFEPLALFYYADALRNNAKYSEAKFQYILYGTLVPEEKDKIAFLIESCDKAAEWLKKPLDININNEARLNTSFYDLAPIYYKKGLIFSSDREIKTPTINNTAIYGWTGNFFLKLLYSEKDSLKNWKEPVPLSPVINTLYHNAVATVSQTQDTMYFTRTIKLKNHQKIRNKKVKIKGKDADFINRFELYSSYQIKGEWANVKSFQYNDLLEFSIGHPSLSKDGRVLYFASDMPGGYGQSDLYYCEKINDSTWAPPKNLGPQINTPFDEEFPSVADDSTLYFSSTGHVGMGGLDLFSAKGNRGEWKEITNLQYPLNSPKDDFCIILSPDKTTGYLTSNRNGGLGSDDIYSFKINVDSDYYFVLEGIVVKKGTDIPINKATVTLINSKNKKEEQEITIEDGKFRFILGKESSYSVTGQKENYYNDRKDNISTIGKRKSETLYARLELDSLEMYKAVRINNIYYDLDKWFIRKDAAIELNKIVKLLKDNPLLKIELGSHTDCRQTVAYNQVLSQKRAQAAVNYIVSKGISRKRLTARGYGESQLINDCACEKDYVSRECTDDEHQMNRRTEFKVIGIIPKTRIIQ